MMALGAAIYLVSAVGADTWIIHQPRSNILAQIALIALLSLGLVTVLEGVLWLLGVARKDESYGSPYRSACLAVVAYSLSYGPYVFINVWWSDDWGYLVWDHSFSFALLTKALNDHLSPLLNVIIWATTNIFGLDYIGIACLQHGVFVLLLLAVAHLFWAALKDARWSILFLVTYASWPTHGDARFWLGGGFWLSASAAFLMLYLLHAQSRVAGEKQLTPFDLTASLILAAMTVFISSQTMIPVVYLLCLVAPIMVTAREPMNVARRIGALAGLSLVPTVLIFIGRSIYVQRAGFDLSGLLQGDLIRNTFLFFAQKIVFMLRGDLHGARYQLEAAGVFVVLFVAPIALALGVLFDKWRRRDGSNGSEWAARVGLILLGCGLIALLFTQIGAARNWVPEAVLGSYYGTLPMLAFWIALFGAVATLVAAAASRSRPEGRKVAAACAVGGVLIIEMALAVYSIHKHEPLRRRIAASEGQRDFLQKLGTAVCSLAVSHPGESVVWRPKYTPGIACSKCVPMLGDPPYLNDGRGILTLIAPPAARRICNGADADRVTVSWSKTDADTITDGADNPDVQRFYDTFVAAHP
jgi:hypothetical protein